MTLADIDILSTTLWAEGRSEPVEGRIAIASVIRNRLRLNRWGSTYTAVCRAPLQFSCWNAGSDANHVALMALVAQIVAGTPTGDPILRECYWIADGCQSGAMRDAVSGATHYHVATMQPRPAWAIGETPICQVAAHLFYRGIA